MTNLITPATTASEIVEGVDLSGRRMIITGGASGIGMEAAQTLARAGAEITLAVRDLAAGSAAADQINRDGARTPVQVAHLDLEDQTSIARFAEAWNGPLHVLVNNAGVMAIPERETTPEGWEKQFAVNHLGHAALMLRLHPALAQAEGARVVAVSSSAHLRSPVHFDDLHFERRAYDPISAYAQAKTAVVLFAVAAAHHWAPDDITVNALHPGVIRTPLQRHYTTEALQAIGANDETGAPIEVPQGWKTRQQGASTTVLLAASPTVAGITGRYFEDNHEAEPAENPMEAMSGIADYAVDHEIAERVWTVTRKLLDL